MLAYVLKFKIPFITLYLWNLEYGVIQHHAQIEPYLSSLWLVVGLALFTILNIGGYRLKVGVLTEVDEFIKMTKAMSITILGIVFIQFYFPLFPGSRMVILYFWVISIILLSLFRLIIFRFEIKSYAKGKGIKHSVIIGTGHLSQDIAERMVLYPQLGYFYLGSIDDAPPEKVHFHLQNYFKLIGTLDSFEALYNKSPFDAVFLVKRDISNVQYRHLSLFCMTNGIELNVLTEPVLNNPFNQFRTFDGIPIVSTNDFSHRYFSLIFKRVFDIVVSFLGLVAMMPVFIITAIWIRLVSPGAPIFYMQERVGFNNQSFNMIKFRSMVPDAESNTGPIMVNESGDNRYIKGGKFLRQLSIDELPQLWNVLKGEMSIVGPRPERPYFVQQFSKALPMFEKRHLVPVGITGWAQINGRSVLTRRPEHKIKYDFYYINNWSLLLDFKICIKTLFVVFLREESY